MSAAFLVQISRLLVSSRPPGSDRRCLGAPDLRGVCPKRSRVRNGAFEVVALQAGLQPLLPEAVQRSFEEASIPSSWEVFLGSISAGVNDEVLFQLGLMTHFVLLGAKLLWQGKRSAAGVV